MSLRTLTGRAAQVKSRLFAELLEAMRGGERPLLLVVPAQYTLEAELETMRALEVSGSFRLQVLSPERLYARIFEEAGRPRAVRIDEQGRVMLMQRAAAKLAGALSYYRGAAERTGFAERAVCQVARFKQAGQTCEDIRQLAGRQNGALAGKLRDLALLYEAYERSLSGRYLDGEDEEREAAARVARAPKVRGSLIWFYGFDLYSPSLSRALIALGRACPVVTAALVVENDPAAPDRAVYQSAKKSLDRLLRLARNEGVAVEQARAAGPAAPGAPAAVAHLERHLNAYPLQPLSGATASARAYALKNPQDEAEFAAALTRRLVMERGWRYRDVQIACQSLDAPYAGALKRAFALYGVPLFLSSSRGADKHPLAVALLSALKLAVSNFRAADMALYARSGFAPVEDEEADLLLNYAAERGLKGRAWLRPLTRGDPALLERLEPARARLVAPLEALVERARAARDTDGRLAAVFGFLEDVGACGRLEQMQKDLTQMGRREWAMEGAQVWNRIVGALDQLSELLGGERLSLRAIYDLLRRALAAAEVKALPQSADAVMGGELDHVKSRPVRALIVLGAVDAVPAGDGGLLGDEEVSAIEESERVYLGLSALDRGRMARLGLKNDLAFVSDLFVITRPLSDMQGSALKPGALYLQIRRLLPDVPEGGGLAGERAMTRLRLGAPEAAMARLGARLRADADDPLAAAALNALLAMPAWADRARRALSALSHRVGSEKLPPALAARVGGAPEAISASRLERYAACPFQDFVRYGLRPAPNRELDLTSGDIGTFYHAAIERFTRESEGALAAMSAEEAIARMDAVTGDLMDELTERAAGESAVRLWACKGLCAVARRAAATIARQLSGSKFTPCALEMEFGLEGARIELNAAGASSALGGRIDRVDEWRGEAARYLRVIDYKTGGRALNLAELYYGLQLQLAVYLAAALKARGGRAAGVFYFNVSDPVVATELRDPAAVEALRQKELRLDGLVLREEEVVRAMADDPEAALPVRVKADGQLSGDKLLAPEDFQALIDCALRRAAKTLSSLRAGETAIAPYRLAGRDACAFCDYRGACQWEEGLAGAELRKLKPMRADEALRRMRDEAGLDAPEA